MEYPWDVHERLSLWMRFDQDLIDMHLIERIYPALSHEFDRDVDEDNHEHVFDHFQYD